MCTDHLGRRWLRELDATSGVAKEVLGLPLHGDRDEDEVQALTARPSSPSASVREGLGVLREISLVYACDRFDIQTERGDAGVVYVCDISLAGSAVYSVSLL